MRRIHVALTGGFLGLLLVLLLAACGSNVPATTGPAATPVHTDLDVTARPTAGAPTDTPGSSTPGPEVTPAPSQAPSATASPAAPTVAPPTAPPTVAPTVAPTGAPATSPPTPASTPEPTPQPTPTPTPEPTGPLPSPGPIAVDSRPCPRDIAKGWTCVQLTVPLDHFHDIGRTTHVTFAIKRHTAKGPAMGTWVTITGGPGTAGIYSAVSYTDTFDPKIRKNYDLVFMDQRGSGMSDSFTCPNAALALYVNPAGPNDPDGGAALEAGAQGFVAACLAESRVDPTTLPYYATRQAVEDLEAFRRWLGVDTLSLYGESYGTQYVQTYAAAHPDAVKVLFTDGPVDLATSGEAFYVEGVKAFENALDATLLDCTTQQACSADVAGGNELSAYEQLAAKLAQAPLDYTFTRQDGSQETRQFTLSDLQTTAIDSMSSEGDRQLFQRAMVPASRGQVWWLARLLYGGLGQDPDTLAAIPDPSYADALYYAVECVDYAYFTDAGDTAARASAYLAYGAAHGLNGSDMASDYYGDLPCVYWPVQPEPDPRPVPAGDAPYPMVILGATLDPSTPFPNAERIMARRTSAAGTWLIYKPGGPHIIFGRGERCPDVLVTRILVRGVFPSDPTTVCPGDVASDYTHVPAASARDEGGTRAVFKAIDDEINAGVDYWYWDYAEPLKFGCPFGGTIKYAPNDPGSYLTLDACAFFDGLQATGTGQIDDVAGTFALNLTFSGTGTSTKIHYLRDESGRLSTAGDRLHDTPGT